MAKVQIYTTPTCHFCKMAKEYFNEKNYSKIYELLNITIEKQEIKSDECIICYEKSNLETICNHNYCDECFIKYHIIDKHTTCGYCRQIIHNDNKIIIKK